MASLYCARCGLRTKITPAVLLLENCPRCLARGGTLSPLVVSSPARPAARREAPTARPRQPTAPHAKH